MTYQLRPHPSTPCPNVKSIDVEVDHAASLLRLRYRLTGDIESLLIPVDGAAERRDELWRHTCCEMFCADDGEAYREFNFAPSEAWAAYEFDSYRRGMRPSAIVPPSISAEIDATTLVLAAEISIDHSSAALGLACVVETKSGELSYWALRHPQSRPDFHDRGGWIALR